MTRRNTPQDFWRFVDESGDCHVWTGAKNRKGYGQFKINGTLHIATRYIYEQIFGRIPPEMCVLHTCDNPPCVRLEHLWVGTHQQNADDKMAKGRHRYKNRTACKKGHPYSEQNTRIRTDGARQCRTCENAHCRESYERIYKYNPVRRAARNLTKRKGGKDGNYRTG